MEGGRLPARVDLIEILYARGEMMLPDVVVQVGSERVAWGVIAALARDRIGAVRNRDGRELADWEVAALVRARTKGSGEVEMDDSELVLRSGPNIEEAYHREFGDWFWRGSE